MSNNGNTFLGVKSQYTHQVMTLSSIINILETIFSNDSDIDGSYETSSTIPVA